MISGVYLYIFILLGEAAVDGSNDAKSLSILGGQHVLVCALHELGSLVLRLGTSASPLVAEPATGMLIFVFP